MSDAVMNRLLDTNRLNALRKTYLMDTKAEEAFDRLTRLSARVLGAPVSLISLIDDKRQFMKSAEGLQLQELPLSHSFCKHVVATGEPLVVNDARQHPLVQDNPAVAEMNAIGYLGIPLLTSDGYNIGSLCVIDTEPRHWTNEEVALLKDLASTVMMEIELRLQMMVEQEAGRTLTTTDLYGKLPETNRFGVYTVEREIGSGGMATVYKCRHEVLGTSVAIKQLRNNSHGQPDYLERFEQEAKIVAQLKHPNIVRVFDYGTQNKMPYMVMEYIHGVDLESYLAQHGMRPFLEDGGILIDIAEALDYAHMRGIVHRDIKPSNVMLRSRYRDGKSLNNYHATLMDFGIAKIAGNESSNITENNLIGTVNYMPPEQIKSDDVDYRADLYSFGILAYQFLTGHLPFSGNNFAATLQKQLNTPMPDPRQYVPDLDPNFVDALEQMLAKNPEDRPDNALEFIKMLA